VRYDSYMKILMDIRLLARGGTTGISGYTQDLLQALFELDSENQYQLFYNAFRKKSLPVAWYHKSNVTILERRIPNRLLDLSFRVLNGPKLPEFRAADLVFSPHFMLTPPVKTPHVITFHDLSFLHHPQFFSNKQHVWHWLQNYKVQAERAAHIIAVSEFTKFDLIKLLGVPEKKITVIQSGVNEEIKHLYKDTEFQESLHKKYQFEWPYFLSLGTIEPRKNILALIRAFSFLKEDPAFKFHKLIVAGKKGFGFEDVAKEAKQSKYSSDILFLHSVPDEDRVYLYTWARAFIYPSFFEGFGFPPLEAQVCQTPVLASDRTSLPEILGDSALLFNPWSVTELTKKLFELETNETLREDLISRGTKNVERFNWSEAARKTREVFKQSVL